MAIETIKSEKKSEQKKRKGAVEKQVKIDDQARLAQILNDSPRVASLAGTEWEVRPLRMGTQWLIAERVCEICKNEEASFGDVVKELAKSVPAVLDILTLALLNDKNKIYEGGVESNGLSELFKKTRDTLEWECNIGEFGNLLVDVLQMIDVDFFFQTTGILRVFRIATTEKKRMRTAEPR